MSEQGYGNSFLAKVMAVVRADRPKLSPSQPYFNRIERVPAGRYAELWFRSAGCSWDKQGGCTMCNYGASQRPTIEEIAAAIRNGLMNLPTPVEELMISPSGSMLDPIEVEPALRRQIYSMAFRHDTKKFLIETRSEYVTDKTMSELRASQPCDRTVIIEIGLESADSWKLRYCINKGHGVEDFTRAAEVARRHGVEVYANICLGTAFLSPLEALEDTYTSAIWALENGARHVVLFPLHIKPYTLLDVLARDGRYHTVSLWSLVEVLNQINPALLHRVEIAWYRSYYDTEAKILKSPSTCPACHDAVVTLLDEYRATQTRDAVDRLVNYQCGCRQKWLGTLTSPTEPLRSRVLREYRALADSYGLSEFLVQRIPEFFGVSETRGARGGQEDSRCST